VSYAAESNELYILLCYKDTAWASFPEKAANHLRQMKTLREAKSEVIPKQKQPQGFQRPPRDTISKGANPTASRDVTNLTPMKTWQIL